MVDIRTVLKYKREIECWVCDSCESENSMAFGKCTLCGERRGPSSVILENWVTEQRKEEAMRAEAARRAAARRAYGSVPSDYRRSEKIFRDDDDYKYEYEEEKSSWWAAIAFFVVFVFIILCIALANS